MIILERLAQLEGLWREVTDNYIDIEYTKVLWEKSTEKYFMRYYCGNNRNADMTCKTLHKNILKEK